MVFILSKKHYEYVRVAIYSYMQSLSTEDIAIYHEILTALNIAEKEQRSYINAG